MFARSDRRHVGLSVLLAACVAAVTVAVLGLHMAFVGHDPVVAEVHARIALFGFLGLAIVDVSYQFYPPAVSSVPGINGRAAMIVGWLLVTGLSLEIGEVLVGVASATVLGRRLALAGALLHANILLAVFWERWDR